MVKTVLIVDDNAFVRRALSKLLTRELGAGQPWVSPCTVLPLGSPGSGEASIGPWPSTPASPHGRGHTPWPRPQRSRSRNGHGGKWKHSSQNWRITSDYADWDCGGCALYASSSTWRPQCRTSNGWCGSSTVTLNSKLHPRESEVTKKLETRRGKYWRKTTPSTGLFQQTRLITTATQAEP